MDPLELVAFCAWCFATALTGGLVGLVLGNIRLPMVLLVASNPATGAGANIGISGVAALAAAATHVRAGRINWRLSAWMAQPVTAEEIDVRAAVLTGAAIGTLGGLVGLILGSLRMPALLRYVGEEPARAVGTNLAVGVCVGVAGVVGHTPGGVDWTLLAAGSAASIPGALLGARLTGRLSEAQLLRSIGAVLLLAGVATAAQAMT